jgi:glucokinase
MSAPRAGRPLAIGLDVGGTKVLGVVIDDDATVIAEETVDSPGRPEDLALPLRDLCRDLARQIGANTAAITAIGIALPGLVDRHGRLHAAPNLGASAQVFDALNELGTSARTALSHSLDVRVAVDNDATCAAVSEAFRGPIRDAHDAIVISIGTGIGAGFIMDGRVVRGERGFAGEIGHMVIEPDGPLCPCGRHGCWELYASGNALGTIARRHAEQDKDGALLLALGAELSDVRGEHVIEAARRGEALVDPILREYTNNVALGISNVVELLDPKLVVIAGGLSLAADVLLEPVREAYVALSRPMQRIAEGLIVAARFGPHSAAIGAGLMMLLEGSN